MRQVHLPRSQLLPQNSEQGRLGDHEQALEDYNKTLAIALDNADAYYARGFTLALQEERKQSALEAYQKAEKLYRQQGKTDYAPSRREPRCAIASH